MAIDPGTAAALGKVGGDLLGFGLNKLFGGSRKGGLIGALGPAINLLPTRINTPSFSLKPNFFPGGFNTTLTRTQTPFEALSPEQQRLFSSLSEAQGTVKPGFGALTEAGVLSLQRARDQRIGNLREQLARRGVLGSSFGESQQASEELAFAEAEAEFRAQSLFQEIELTVGLVREQNAVLDNQIRVELEQLGLAGDFALSIFNTGVRASAIQEQLAAEAAAGAGAFFGTLGSDIGDIFGPTIDNVTGFEVPPQPAPPKPTQLERLLSSRQFGQGFG